MKTSDYSYILPKEYIAQHPVTPRDSSRLLIYDRDLGNITHRKFHDLSNYLIPGDLLVVNQTQVIPARMFGKKIPTGGKVELLLLRRVDKQLWNAMVGGKGLKPGVQISLDGGPIGEITEDLGGPQRLIHFLDPIQPYLDRIGHVPLPPYIHETLDKPDRYQTVYAAEPGSAAAPTAGLHFTPQLLENIQKKGVNIVDVTLHIGLDTFAPVHEEEPQNHVIHKEWCQLSEATAQAINQTRSSGGRIIAVGTTSVRTLETAAKASRTERSIKAYEGDTDLYILPGYEFQIVDCMITNFHLPESTLLMMVSAFAGRENILDLYQTAMEIGYRFYSFGDGMILI